jgi:hypothetical protein
MSHLAVDKETARVLLSFRRSSYFEVLRSVAVSTLLVLRDAHEDNPDSVESKAKVIAAKLVLDALFDADVVLK